MNFMQHEYHDYGIQFPTEEKEKGEREGGKEEENFRATKCLSKATHSKSLAMSMNA